MDRKEQIHQKLEIMRKCYKERSLENLDLFYDTFFSEACPIIQTDGGPWFATKERIYQLITYDWEHWGDVELQTWGFEFEETEEYVWVKVQALLDFGKEHVWDMEIVMVMVEEGEELYCRFMQFYIPRNALRPTVILNKSEKEWEKFKREIESLVNSPAQKASQALAEELLMCVKENRPDFTDVVLPKNQIIIERKGAEMCFAAIGLAKNETAQLPVRIIGIGNPADGKLRKYEISYPFFCNLE